MKVPERRKLVETTLPDAGDVNAAKKGGEKKQIIDYSSLTALIRTKHK